MAGPCRRSPGLRHSAPGLDCVQTRNVVCRPSDLSTKHPVQIVKGEPDPKPEITINRRKIPIPSRKIAINRRKIAIPRDDLSFLRRGDTIPPRDVRFSRERLLGAREALRATSDTPWVYRDTRGLPPIPLGSTCDTLGFVRWGVAPVRRSLARVSRGVPMQSEGPCRHRGALHLATLGKRVTARFILRERNACASKSDARPSSSHFAAKGQPCIRETGHETARPTRAPRKTQLDRARPSDRSRRCS